MFHFVIRASTEDGFGHLIRCRAVARYLATSAAVRMFVVGDKVAETLLRGEPYETFVDVEESRVFRQIGCPINSVIVFDLTHCSESRFTHLKNRNHTVSLSPVFSHLNEVDTFVHRSHEPPLGWEVGIAKGQFFGGLEFAVVDELVAPVDDLYPERIHSNQRPMIGISMGGGDASNLTKKVVDALLPIRRGCSLLAVLGAGYLHSIDELIDMARRSNHEFVVVRSDAYRWHLLTMCSLVLIRGGITAFEVVRAGIPSVNLLEQPHERKLLSVIEERGATKCVSLAAPDCWPQIYRVANRLIAEEREALVSMHRCSSGLIDGRGAYRISQLLSNLHSFRES